MKNVAVLVTIALAVSGSTLFSRIGRAQAQASSAANSPREVFEGLRNLALTSSRQKLGLPAPPAPTRAWGVVMDWVVTNDTVTIVAFSDGSASLYLSSGGGFLGGGSHEPVRNAAQRMVAAAVECQRYARATSDFPLPERGRVNFYFRTDAGVLTASALEADLRQHRGPLAILGDAGQDVITQYRLIQK